MTNLGDRVKDKVTGFCGLVTAKTTWMNGCVRVGVQSEKLKDGIPQEVQWIDEAQLTVVKRGIVKPGYEDTGGPMPISRRAQDPHRR